MYQLEKACEFVVKSKAHAVIQVKRCELTILSIQEGNMVMKLRDPDVLHKLNPGRYKVLGWDDLRTAKRADGVSYAEREPKAWIFVTTRSDYDINLKHWGLNSQNTGMEKGDKDCTTTMSKKFSVSLRDSYFENTFESDVDHHESILDTRYSQMKNTSPIQLREFEIKKNKVFTVQPDELWVLSKHWHSTVSLLRAYGNDWKLVKLKPSPYEAQGEGKVGVLPPGVYRTLSKVVTFGLYLGGRKPEIRSYRDYSSCWSYINVYQNKASLWHPGREKCREIWRLPTEEYFVNLCCQIRQDVPFVHEPYVRSEMSYQYIDSVVFAAHKHKSDNTYFFFDCTVELIKTKCLLRIRYETRGSDPDTAAAELKSHIAEKWPHLADVKVFTVTGEKGKEPFKSNTSIIRSGLRPSNMIDQNLSVPLDVINFHNNSSSELLSGVADRKTDLLRALVVNTDPVCIGGEDSDSFRNYLMDSTYGKQIETKVEEIKRLLDAARYDIKAQTLYKLKVSIGHARSLQEGKITNWSYYASPFNEYRIKATTVLMGLVIENKVVLTESELDILYNLYSNPGRIEEVLKDKGLDIKSVLGYFPVFNSSEEIAKWYGQVK